MENKVGKGEMCETVCFKSPQPVVVVAADPRALLHRNAGQPVNVTSTTEWEE